MPGSLFHLLAKKTGSSERASRAIAAVAEGLGMLDADPADERLAALALCKRGAVPEEVSKHLGWKDFEAFCSSVLRAGGYRVRENIYLRKPRAQIDVFGVSGGVALAVDCKHWSASPGYGTLSRLVEAQRARAKRLHEGLDDVPPVASVILTLVDSGVRFVEGGAVVPISTFRDFLENVEAYRDSLEWV